MSLLDAWEDDGAAATYDGDALAEELEASGFITTEISEEKPIFALERVEFKPQGLVQMVVSNNVAAIAQENCHVAVVNLVGSDLSDIEISRRPDDRIHRIFLDPTGNHLLVSMVSGDNLYIARQEKKPKVLAKLKGMVIESVAWNRQEGTSSATHEILLGTTKGAIVETSIEGKEKYSKSVSQLDPNTPITGLYFERFPPTPTEQAKFFICATTATRIYQFVGGPNFEAVFQNYTNPGFHELPGNLPNSELHFFSKYDGLAKSFAWMTEPGIYHGNLIFGSQNPGDSVMSDNKLLPYPALSSGKVPQPVSIGLTEWHWLVLYKDCFQAVSRLNEEVVHEESLTTGRFPGAVCGIARDPVKLTYWLFTTSAIFELLVNNEERDVWRLYLEREKFQNAMDHCKDAAQRDKVLSVQAEHYYSRGMYDMAATFFARTQRSFEEIALKFLNQGERDALKTYLIKKLENLKEVDSTQRTIICTWLTEISLDQLNALRADDQAEQKQMVLDEFRQFLSDHKKHLDPATTINLISSHGRVDELLFFAEAIEDYERVISHHIQRGEYESALDVMGKQSNEELFYRFSPILMRYAPHETVNIWMRVSSFLQPHGLDPRRLMPALMRYDPATSHSPGSDKQNQAIRYLKYCVGNLQNTDPAIHNYLLSLYAAQDDETELLSFINRDPHHFDIKYALRICTKEGRKLACVHIYSLMGLYQEAVDLSLEVDVDLAKEIAEKPEDDEALRKNLWLRIARHVVEKDKDIKKAIAFLSQSDLLKIEDILPFFPDFTLIDDFKDEICASLEDYNRHIEELKMEMDDATRSAELIRHDIKDLRNRYGYVSASQKCGLCGYLALARQLYMFPCQCVFHADCLAKEAMRHFNSAQKAKFADVEQRIARLEIEVDQMPAPTSTLSATSPMATPAGKADKGPVERLDEARAEFDAMVASECLFCGDLMIKSIDNPFVGDSAADKAEAASWELR